MPKFNNGESAASVRQKINDAIDKVDGVQAISDADITGGTIDNTVIGGVTPAAGTFSSATVNGNITVTGTVDGRDVAADGAKLDGIEAGADVTDTANVTAAGAVMDSELTNEAAVKALDQGVATTDSPTFAAATINGNITVTGTVDGRDVAADGTKLDGIEAGATADQTPVEIKTAYESNLDTNAYTDAEKSKLAGIEAGADVTDVINVTAAGALMDSELTNITAVKALDQGVATTDSPTFAATTINGNITVTGTVDGRDVAADGTKLDGIEAGADVTDATNVEAAGAVMESDTTTAAMSFVIDEDTMVSNLDTKVPTQQSVKAYVDGRVASSVEYAGGYNAATNTPDLDTSPSGITKGDMYTVTAAGTFFTIGVEIGDVLISEVDNPSVESDWTIVNKNLDAASIKTAYESNADTNAFTDAEQTKLSGIEAGADVTDTANVTAAGALMDSELTNEAAVKALNQGVATTDSPSFAGMTTTADITFGDNDKAIFGAGSDLQIYHDGSDSYIKEDGTGNLIVAADDFRVTNVAVTETMIAADTDSSVRLYFDNALKLATTSTGVDVTGTVTADGLTSVLSGDTQGKFSGWSVVGANTASGAIELGQTPAYQGVISYAADASTRFIFDNTYGSTASTFEFRSNTSATPKTHMKITGGGDISFYEDTGTTPKFFWDASAEKVEIAGSGGLKFTGGGVSQDLVWGSSSSDYAAIRVVSPAAQDVELSFHTTTNAGVDGTPERMRIDASGNVGIGTSSPDVLLHVNSASSTGRIRIQGGGTSSAQLQFVAGGQTNPFVITQDASRNLIFYDNATERMRIDSSGRVGVGTTSMSSMNSYGSGFTVGNSGISGSAGMTVYASANTGYSSVYFGDPDDTKVGWLEYSHGSDSLAFGAGNSERMRINSDGSVYWKPDGTTQAMTLDASGNLLVGTTDTSIATANSGYGFFYEADSGLKIARQAGTSSNPVLILNNSSTTVDSEILRFNKAGATVGSIGAAGGIFYLASNTASGAGGIRFGNDVSTTLILPSTSAGANKDGNVNLGYSNSRFKNLYLSGATNYGSSSDFGQVRKTGGELQIDSYGTGGARHPIKFTQYTTEVGRFDASGNLMVGTTSASGSGDGIVLGANDQVIATRNGAAPLWLNRRSNDGDIALFNKDGTTVGSIGTASGDLTISSSGSNPVRLQYNGNSVAKVESGSLDPANDNTQDLGQLGVRWDDIYATNGTIQTSDEREKQDIDVLSDAEQRVAVAAKGLLRKFRWKDAVAEKGDDARIHFGIIAQDLQAAFEAEGLDAGRYGMFIHTTWTDEETGEERSRMGVRYSELLAFIVAAI